MIERITNLLGPELTTRLFAIVSGLAALGGCPLHGDGNHAEVRDEAAVDAPLGEMVVCALDGSHQFAEDCNLERTAQAGREYLVVRRPDGSFHRLVMRADRQGLASADGAFAAQAVLVNRVFEVKIAGDSYRIPQTAPTRPGL